MMTAMRAAAGRHLFAAAGLTASTCALVAGAAPRVTRTEETSVTIRVDATSRVAPMRHVWAWFGYDEPNYTYMKDGKKLLSQLAELSPVPVYVRAHNLLTSGDGTPALKWGSTNAYT